MPILVVIDFALDNLKICGRLTSIEGKIIRKMRHQLFLGRTVMVQNGAVEKALKQVDGLMTMDGMLKVFRLTRRYEKPNVMRRRVNYEKCKALYDEDMTRKINFAMRVSRPDPYPGCH